MQKTAILLPGHASQYFGMGKAIYEEYSQVKELFEEANEILGMNLQSICFSGNTDELHKFDFASPALLVCSYAAYKIYSDKYGLKPQLAAGHSIGEISALTCAGAISFANAVKITHQRGIFMEKAIKSIDGKMVAITQIENNKVEELCNEFIRQGKQVSISNYNAPSQIIISGLNVDVDSFCKIIESIKGAEVVQLEISIPSHSMLMKPVAQQMEDELKKYAFGEFCFPVISNVDGLPYSDPLIIREKLVSQLMAPVQWQKTLHYMDSQKVECIIETGPKNILRNLVGKNNFNIEAYSTDVPEDLKELQNQSQKRAIVAKRRISVVSLCLGAAVATPNKNWEEEEYKNGVLEPYRKIEALYQAIELEQRNPTLNEMEESIALLQCIFKTKKVSLEEQKDRLEYILKSTRVLDKYPELMNTMELVC